MLLLIEFLREELRESIFLPASLLAAIPPNEFPRLNVALVEIAFYDLFWARNLSLLDYLFLLKLALSDMAPENAFDDDGAVNGRAQSLY